MTIGRDDDKVWATAIPSDRLSPTSTPSTRGVPLGPNPSDGSHDLSAQPRLSIKRDIKTHEVGCSYAVDSARIHATEAERFPCVLMWSIPYPSRSRRARGARPGWPARPSQGARI